MKKFIVIVLALFLLVGCKTVQVSEPSFQVGEFTCYGENVTAKLPHDIHNCTTDNENYLYNALPMGMFTFALFFQCQSEKHPNYAFIVPAQECGLLALTEIDGEEMRHWIYNDKGEPVPCDEATIDKMVADREGYEYPPKHKGDSI